MVEIGFKLTTNWQSVQGLYTWVGCIVHPTNWNYSLLTYKINTANWIYSQKSNSDGKYSQTLGKKELFQLRVELESYLSESFS